MANRGASYRRQAPPPIITNAGFGMDDDYDYGAATAIGNARSASPDEPTDEHKAYGRHVMATLPPPPPPPKVTPPAQPQTPTSMFETDEALLDLEQLEELHQEAEKMKALGNRHMALQEYTRAYNAYSAALQLSPVGPSSHVFLSNRAAALLSLKRYAAAATDARRAVALAPTFGKAHARLGQSLYFLKDYEGAVAAYEDAVHFEPDNEITITYLEKAKAKLSRQQEKAYRQARGEEISLAGESLAFTVANSIATDPNASAAVVTSGFRGSSKVIMAAVARGSLPEEVNMNRGNHIATTPMAEEDEEEQQDDPDFDEAVKIHQTANKYLASKRYKEAIEQYSAALFLVPDDPYLSPELHLGRAHALNGSRRHESARNDAILAIKIQPSSEGYATLAKSLFYMRDYLGSVEAFEKCIDILPEGESLSTFDEAYLRKAEAAWQDELERYPDDSRSVVSTKSVVPKLPPPRFVPREKAINSTPNLPPMPKHWPQQSPRSPLALMVGPERSVSFLSESLGIKLNRGTDGIVRVLSVSPETPGSPVLRNGKLEVGDIIREAAGVDIRRPITNIMWGDTVALIKMAPRPITFVVAKELSEPPSSVLDERQKAASGTSPTSLSYFHYGDEEKREEEVIYNPSPASGDESVKQSIAMQDKERAEPTLPIDLVVADGEVNDTVDFTVATTDAGACDMISGREFRAADAIPELSTCEGPPQLASSSESMTEGEGDAEAFKDDQVAESGTARFDENDYDEVSPTATGAADRMGLTSRDMEAKLIGGEIVFQRSDSQTSPDEWDNLRWLSTNGTRKVRYCEVVSRVMTARKGLFWTGEDFVRRKLAIYEEPCLLLVLRPPTNAAEVRRLLDLPSGVEIGDGHNALQSFLVAESVIDPKTCKLKLSPLTTVTSVDSSSNASTSSKRRTCFELLTPRENVVLSVLSSNLGGDGIDAEQSLEDMFLATAGLEHVISSVLHHAHNPNDDESPSTLADVAWKHQIIQGSLHSFVITGNQALLEKAVDSAVLEHVNDTTTPAPSKFARPQVIDAQDESGRTALHYACSRRASAAVSVLIGAGANASIPVGASRTFPCHLSAQMLDEKSLSTILSASYPMRPDPNVVDDMGRTAMYIAAVKGKSVGGGSDDIALGRCLSALEAWGGQMLIAGESDALRHPVSCLASRWSPGEITVVLNHMPFRYPLQTDDAESVNRGISLGSSFHYPLHSALISLRSHIRLARTGIVSLELRSDDRTTESALVRSLRVLVEHGFEPNERLERFVNAFDGARRLEQYVGYAPLQILAAAALDADTLPDSIGAALKQNIVQIIASTAEFLVRSGARLSLDPPPTYRLARSGSSPPQRAISVEDIEMELISHAERTCLKIESNKLLVQLLGGQERLQESKDYWSHIKSVVSTGRTEIHKEKSKDVYEDSNAPGGSDEKSCAICWKAFGALMNRKHKCRVTKRHVCEECSSKRMMEGKEGYRLSDGQFSLARSDATKQETTRQEEQRDQARIRQIKIKQAEEARVARQGQSASTEEANRDSLFGGVIEKAANYVFGEDDDDEDKVGNLTSTMNQTRDALNERGDKLNSLSEKTSKLLDSSRDFARMAKELERSQKGGLFW